MAQDNQARTLSDATALAGYAMIMMGVGALREYAID